MTFCFDKKEESITINDLDSYSLKQIRQIECEINKKGKVKELV